MRNRADDILALVMLVVFVGGFMLGGYTHDLVKSEQIQDKTTSHDAEINRLVDDYDTKLASKELQVAITQSSYAECNKRYTEPRPIVCN